MLTGDQTKTREVKLDERANVLERLFIFVSGKYLLIGSEACLAGGSTIYSSPVLLIGDDIYKLYGAT